MGLIAAPQGRDRIATGGHHKGGLEGINRGGGGGGISRCSCR